MAFIRSISGLRATLSDALTPRVVADYVSALCATLPPGAVAVGRDGRQSGAWIEQVACGSIMASGRDVMQLGIVPTPTVQIFAEMDGIAGGISITASHNPAEYNGLKFLNDRGLFPDGEELERIWQAVDVGRTALVPTAREGQLYHCSDALQKHIQRILSHPAFTADEGRLLEQIRDRQFKVVVDAVNASGSQALPGLLKAFGCLVIPLYCNSSGVFPHTPEPLPKHLGELCSAVRNENASFGIAVDPDADRLVLIDEQGRAVSEELTVVLATMAALEYRSHFALPDSEELLVVVNLSTTRAIEDVAARYGARVLRSPVGEINVVNSMLAHRALIGGEGSGGVIAPQFHAGRDSLVGSALLLLLLAGETRSLGAIVDSLPRYAMVKRKRRFRGDTADLFRQLEEKYPDLPADRSDGLRLQFEKSWVHLRTSNTEPIIRVIAEAPSEEEAQTLASRFLAAVNKA